MKKPPSMATKFQSSIAKTEAVSGTSEVKIMFTDQSGFSFQAVSGDPKPTVNGAGDSLAHEFAAGTNKYTFLAASSNSCGLMQRLGVDHLAEIHVARTPIFKCELHTGGEEGVFVRPGREFMGQ